MAPLIRATVCTGNAHKLDEFKALFPDWDLDLLRDASFPPEDGATYVDAFSAEYGYSLDNQALVWRVTLPAQ